VANEEGTLTGVSCPSATTCEAAVVLTSGGDSFLGSRGGDWTTQAAPSSMTATGAMYCPSASACYAQGGGSAGTQIASTSDAGGAWGVLYTFPQTVSLIDGVACVASGPCEAVGDETANTATILATTAPGGSWIAQDVPANADVTQLAGISCPAEQTCYAVGTVPGDGVVLSSADGGAQWTATEESAVVHFYSISCSTDDPSDCQALGYNNGLSATALGTTDAPADFQAETLPSGISRLFSVSCVTKKPVCVAVGQASSGDAGVVVVKSGSGPWTTESLPAGTGPLNAVSCPSQKACVAVGQTVGSSSPAIVASNDGGLTWTLDSGPTGPGDLEGVSCVSAWACTAVGSVTSSGAATGAVYGTTDGGTAWTAKRLPAGTGVLSAVDCVAATSCVATGVNADGAGLIITDAPAS
jgi:photosystem II stability/assembly factor-like uncharacterized protein